MVKFDPPPKNAKLFCTFETNNCEEYDAQIYLLINNMTECISTP